MLLMRSSEQIPLPKCLPGFEQINRFRDRRNHTVIAKILPGEFYVSNQPEIIATTLGSCVSACIWDEIAQVGGMNHFMLPITEKEAKNITWGNTASATRYGNYAMEHLINEVLKNGGKRINLQAKVFGGGNVINNMSKVGEKNADFVLHYLKLENIPLIASDLGTPYPRKVQFLPATGQAFVKRLESLHNDTIQSREFTYQNSIKEESVGGDVELF